MRLSWVFLFPMSKASRGLSWVISFLQFWINSGKPQSVRLRQNSFLGPDLVENRELWAYFKMVAFPIPLLETRSNFFFFKSSQLEFVKATGSKNHESELPMPLTPGNGATSEFLTLTVPPPVPQLYFKVLMLILVPVVGFCSCASASDK